MHLRWSWLGVVLSMQTGCLFSSDPEEPAPTAGTPTPPGAGWSESSWCDPLGDLSGAEAAFDGSNLRETALSISAIRYPPGEGFIEAQSDGELALWFGAVGAFEDVLDRYEVAVHEGSHIWGFGQLDFEHYSYRVVDDSRIIQTQWLDNFDRAEILDRHPDAGGDFYASIYLTGSMGQQGFNTLLDEYNAYAHSLVARYCTRDSLGGASTSARDGMLTFMFYVQTYLKIAREDHPSDYEAIVADAAHVDLILSVWDRAGFWLEVTSGHSELGIDDAKIQAWVDDPDNMMEIEMLRQGSAR